MTREVFFIIGAPRSGTTMLQLALGRHSCVLSPPETAFFTLVLRSRRGQLRHWRCIQSDLGLDLGPPRSRIRPGGTAHTEFMRIVEAYAQRMNQPNKTHFAEKSPQHQRRISQILKTFPEAKFVVIYRDGRDVANSLRKLAWMPKDLYVNFFVWLHYYRIQRKLINRPDRFICVKYESLVEDPEFELGRILDFLGLPFERNVVVGSGNPGSVPSFEMAYKGMATGPISRSRVETWRNELTDAEVAILESWGGWALKELGYECMTDCRGRIPLLHFPVLYSRILKEIIQRGGQRKVDELLGTSIYRPNRIAAEAEESRGHDARVP